MKVLAYGFPLTGNFGAPSVVHGLREALREAYPDAEFVYYDRGADDPRASSSMDFPVRHDHYHGHPFRLFRDYLLTRFLRMTPGTPDKAAFWRDFHSSDVVFYAYAICFHHKKHDPTHRFPRLAAIRRVFDHYGISILARLTGRQSLKTTASYGPMTTAYERYWARYAARFAFTRFLARECGSKDELLSVVRDRRRVTVAPDVGNLMRIPPVKPVVGKVGIAVSFQMIRQWEGKEGYVDCLCGLINSVRHAFGCSVVLIPNQLVMTDGCPDDAGVAAEVVATLGDASRVSVFDAAGHSPLELKAEIASCEVLVSSRYHATVAGLSSSVPNLVIGWHRKYDEVMVLYGQSAYVIGTSECSVTALTGAFVRLWRSRAEVRAELSGRAVEVRRSVVTSMRQLIDNGNEGDLT